MSVQTYREAARRLRRGLSVLGPFRGPCGLCGNHPDQRHRIADAIAERVAVGDDAESVWADYQETGGTWAVLQLTVDVLAADHRLHSITRARAAGIDREVWAES